MIPGLDLPPETYKPRPLFCVVCASNQVRLFPNIALFSCLVFTLESFNGRSQCPIVGFRLQSRSAITDEVTARLVIE